MFKANKLINNSKDLYSMLYKSLIIGKKHSDKIILDKIIREDEEHLLIFLKYPFKSMIANFSLMKKMCFSNQPIMFEIHVYPNSFTHWIIYNRKLFGKMILQKIIILN